jgi:hypothetical protein
LESKVTPVGLLNLAEYPTPSVEPEKPALPANVVTIALGVILRIR